MNMTYRELLAELKKFSKEELDMNVTVSLDLSEEAVPVKHLIRTVEGDFLDGVLDPNHPVLGVDF